MTARNGVRPHFWWWGAIPLAITVALLALRAGLHVDPRDRLSGAPSLPRDPPGARAQTGSIAVTRGGPLYLGFQSTGPARLTFAGRELRGQGLVKERFVVPAGVVAIGFAGGPDARLVWSPVGRRGDPEYVPASSLSPAEPARATFDHPGTARLDGLIALGLLVTLTGSLVMLARRRLAGVPRATWIAMGAVFVVAVVARLIDLGGAGETWDEGVNWAAGRNYVTNLVALDFSARSWTWNYEHPPVMKLLEGIGAQLADGFGPARGLSAIWISLGCALLVPIGRRLASLRVGVLAAVIAALLPPLVAHGQVVGHEAPTVLWWSLGILLSLCVHDGLEPSAAARRTLLVRLGVVGAVVGIAAGSRFVNGLLGPMCVIIVLLQAPACWRRPTLFASPVMALMSLVTFYAVWPRLWLHPIASLQTSLAKLDNAHSAEPFLGTLTNHPGPYYFVVYLIATLPLGALVAVIAGLVRSVVRVRTRTTWVVLAWLLVPLAVAASPVRQDGVRYVMPCLTALAMLAALGIDGIATRLQRWPNRLAATGSMASWRVAHTFTGLGGLVAAYLAITLVRVHPYYLDYFGEHVGGARTVAHRQWFETAWWGEGVDRAVAYVNAHAAPGARVFRDCIEPSHLAWFREDLWAGLARDPRDASWIVIYAPARLVLDAKRARLCRVPPDARKVFEVEHDGLVFAEVYQRP